MSWNAWPVQRKESGSGTDFKSAPSIPFPGPRPRGRDDANLACSSGAILMVLRTCRSAATTVCLNVCCAHSLIYASLCVAFECAPSGRYFIHKEATSCLMNDGWTRLHLPCSVAPKSTARTSTRPANFCFLPKFRFRVALMKNLEHFSQDGAWNWSAIIQQ